MVRVATSSAVTRALEALDAVLLLEGGRAQRQPAGIELTGEVVLAEIGPVVGPAAPG